MVMDFTSSDYIYYDNPNLNRLKSKHNNELISSPCQVDNLKRSLRCIEDVNLNKRRRVSVLDYDEYTLPQRKSRFEKTISSNRVNADQINNYICDSENYNILRDTKNLSKSIMESHNHTISIHETYQLGYLDNSENDESNNLYVFDFVDGVDVTYPVSIPSSEVLPIDLPPLFMEPKYSDQLNPLASDALNQLTQRIETWLISCQNIEEQLTKWRHMNAHKRSCELRVHILRLLKILVPQFSQSKFDSESPTVDKFLSLILDHLDMSKNLDFGLNVNLAKSIDPVVLLSSDPDNSLKTLRFQILTLVQKLMPHLVLPPNFDFEQDLIPLIDMACVLNKTKCNF